MLKKVAHSVQPSTKKDLREIWLLPNRAAVETAIDVFADKCGAKYLKAVERLTKDRLTLLAFYDFPALSSTTAKLMAVKMSWRRRKPGGD